MDKKQENSEKINEKSERYLSTHSDISGELGTFLVKKVYKDAFNEAINSISWDMEAFKVAYTEWVGSEESKKESFNVFIFKWVSENITISQ